MSSKNIRETFLQFFKKKNHTLVPSDSLVPSSDPSLLFTSAGMVQFKAHFLQQIPLTFTRAASSQRCLRTTDIEAVGRTPRHLTLFEMLGNFSFGDYFKEEAIAWAWEFLTKELALPEKHLYPSIYKDDEEAFKLWKKLVPESKISRMGEEDNFWTMGPTGPCGPCSEIYWDLEEKADGENPSDDDRWMEVWNLVFTQFDRQEDGSMPPLPKKNIDTGMGLERLTSVVERVDNNFQTSLFKPIVAFGEDLFKYKMGKGAQKDVALKIYSDHLRAVTLLVYDGILPSNEGRGYVLRRLLRRAVRQGALFGLKDPFLFKGVPLITDLFKETADQLQKRKDNIIEIVRQEEERFLENLETGSAKLIELVDQTKKTKKKMVSGDDVFRLYDTYGFPPELTKEMLEEHKLSFDEKEFNRAKENAQETAREGWKGSGAQDVTAYNELAKKMGEISFRGYETLAVTTKVQALLKNGKETKSLKPGEAGLLVVKETPFYPEGGGQVGDKGFLKSQESVLATIADAQKPVPGFIVHFLADVKKEIKVGGTVTLEVDEHHREPTKRHHTATHLLHAALRKILGSTVTQAGSLVEPNRLRFDYTYNKPLSAKTINEIEDMVNLAILKNWPVTPKVFSADEAKKMGAMALFGEKYGDHVRCLLISSKGYKEFAQAFSLELCGGTHVSATGDIGGFKIISDTSLAAGVRRMEAITGFKTIDYVRDLESKVRSISDKLKASPTTVESRVEKILDTQKKLEQEVRELKLKIAQGGGAQTQTAAIETQQVNGVNLAVKVNDGLEMKDLRVLADRMKQQIKSGVIFVASTIKDEDREKVSFVVALTNDVKDKGLNAGKLAKSVAQELGGSGGGRPDFAQGGGQNKSKLSAVVEKLPVWIKG